VSYLKTASTRKTKSVKLVSNMIYFPIVILAIYGILFILMPDRTSLALKSSGTILINIIWSLGLVFVIMVLMNLFLKPAQIVRFLGKNAGIKGGALSAVAGIISAGPIYVWYPLLRDLREKGAGYSPISIFLYNRSVKPFLLPVMIGYFGWIFTVILTIFTVLGSFVIGYAVSAFLKKEGD